MSRARINGILIAVVLVLMGAAVALAVVIATRDDGTDENQTFREIVEEALTPGATGPSGSPTPGLSSHEVAEQDGSPDLPGVFVPSQGRRHFAFRFDRGRTPTPYCAGVASADAPSGEPAILATPIATPAGFSCYASNPPSSGTHLNVHRNIDITGNGDFINIPADPDVYRPEIDFGGPMREAIPHILEHAGVFVGYNCPLGDAACDDAVRSLTRTVIDRIDAHNDRVIMGRDSDLVPGTIGLSSWTRVDVFPYQQLDEQRVVDFIDTHSCRFDPEGFCD